MQFQSYKIADLIPASYNPRKKLKPGDKEYEKIKNSIKEFGYVEPIIINSDMTIIGGHQRATVLADLGYKCLGRLLGQSGTVQRTVGAGGKQGIQAFRVHLVSPERFRRGRDCIPAPPGMLCSFRNSA